MNLGVASGLFKYGGATLVVLGLAACVVAALREDSVLTRAYRRYTAYLERSLKLLFLNGSGARIVLLQLLGALAFGIVGLWLDVPFWYALVLLTAVLPLVYLSRKRKEHLKRLESQMDALIMGLANALKTVPSPAAALGQLSLVLPLPMRLEVERVLREMRVGSTLEQALLNMSSRLRSPELDTALSSILIGLQVGGNLPLVLEGTASTIREMGRLEGVVQTKTSEARAQLWVLAVFPFVICLGFRLLDPDYFTPLQTSIVGNLIAAFALVLWLASLLAARKIMKVDI